MAVNWLDEPEAHDFDAATAYLSMLAGPELIAVVALQIADGDHRVCAGYITDENTVVPCLLAAWPS